ncbi:UDP-glucosyltransferase 2-like [Drosophila sulfurigaster albostrigata]|uniref:UDP-glucosyltransferase 2-like n=1 Tax=Drosophila sulfurigaster albostrigata TaxID=89887 RepID=UPI002D21C0B8|nr:UDP-glucosyltransferase 2-like [Drosophila sulfurigaster albostrigata]
MMSPKFQFLAIIAAVLINCTQGANILAVFSCPSPSHLIVEISMAKVLAENGHNVTVVTSMKPHVTHKNMHIIQVDLTEEENQSMKDTMAKLTARDNSDTLSALFRIRQQFEFMFNKNRDVMKDQRVKDLYENKDNKFDLVMIGYFLNNFQIGIAQKLKVPVVLASSMFQWEIFYSTLGNPREIAYVPNIGVFGKIGSTLTFSQRVFGLISFAIQRVFTYFLEKDNAALYYELYGDDPNMPPYEEINKNVSLVLFNTHGLSEGPIRPNMPGVIEVGGIQVKEQPDPLPKDIAEFLDNATDGAILLSLGSNIQGQFLKPETVQKMFNVLSKLKQRIIWKWEDLSKTPGKSANIMYSKWLPQDDILAHPKIMLFINHAGRGGITESQYHGKPMLSLPVFGDQPANADKVVFDEFGLSMSLLTLEEKPFRDNILEILENPKYTQNVKAFSQLFRDRPMSARQTVLYWVEYVLRYHGAPHLQSPLLHMSFITANNLDIFAILFVVLIIIVFVNVLILRLVYRKLTGKSKKDQITNPNKLKTN